MDDMIWRQEDSVLKELEATLEYPTYSTKVGFPIPFSVIWLVGKSSHREGQWAALLHSTGRSFFFFSFLALPRNVWYLSSWQGIEPEPPALKVWSL